ncbi:hypothetical protein CF75_gp015 [Staphylococcus phage phiSA12]|uniref:Uncharacterized protein n=1 Tax=Staphylococcus phage phiSA12 TaxID=1450142 RepID=W0TU59_9CAUD|nr:hypothetical protein CF75_gp015 [Staphylococcus phage phiSA12]BAO47062.1 hypothetical protein [Staphylococcus phage phiSA12]
MEKIYILEEEIEEMDYDLWEEDTVYTTSYEVLGYTDSLEDAEYIRDNYGTSNPIFINEYPYLTKEKLIEEQRYFIYNSYLELKRVNGYFEISEINELHVTEDFSINKDDKNFDSPFSINMFSHNRNSIGIEFIMFSEYNDKEDIIEKEKNSFLMKLKYLLKHSKEADIRRTSKIIDSIDKLT